MYICMVVLFHLYNIPIPVRYTDRISSDDDDSEKLGHDLDLDQSSEFRRYIKEAEVVMNAAAKVFITGRWR